MSATSNTPLSAPAYPCRHFGQCGGCKTQDRSDADNARGKQLHIQAALRANGHALEVDAPVNAFGIGRRRATLHARKRGRDSVELGFREARTHNIIDMTQCPVLVPAIVNALPGLRDLAALMLPPKGAVDVRVLAAENGLGVDIVAPTKNPIAASADARMALTDLAIRNDLARLSVNGDLILETRAPYVLMGRAKVVPSADSFLQATFAAEQALADLVVAALPPQGLIADLFCGLGPFALRIAERQPVEAWDHGANMINALVATARTTQGLKPLAAKRRDLFQHPLGPEELQAFAAIVMDPPRAGAREQAKLLAQSAVPLVVSVSCAADSFARDARILVEGGYTLQRVTPVDQFRWSDHVEMVGIFRKG